MFQDEELDSLEYVELTVLTFTQGYKLPKFVATTFKLSNYYQNSEIFVMP
jgi:hypothetical protein